MKTPILIAAMAAATALTLSPAMARDHGQRPDFETLDANGDGVISPDEFANPAEARFAAVDADGDGALDRAELLARARADFEARVEGRIDQMIDRMDADGDGRLTLEEMRRGPGDGDGIFGRVDTDGDGMISEAEFEELRARLGDRRGGPRPFGRGN